MDAWKRRTIRARTAEPRDCKQSWLFIPPLQGRAGWGHGAKRHNRERGYPTPVASRLGPPLKGRDQREATRALETDGAGLSLLATALGEVAPPKEIQSIPSCPSALM